MGYTKTIALFISLSVVATLFSFVKPSDENVETITKNNAQINWLTWEEALNKNEDNPRKFLIDIYTDWCGWCKRMDKATFQQADIAAYVNENYYAIKFNAEQRATIKFKGKEYNFKANGKRGYHELAAHITNGRLSYPTIVFLDKKLDLIQTIPGYRAPNEFEQIATYFGGNNHKKTPWESYQENYVPLAKKN